MKLTQEVKTYIETVINEKNEEELKEINDKINEIEKEIDIEAEKILSKVSDLIRKSVTYIDFDTETLKVVLAANKSVLTQNLAHRMKNCHPECIALRNRFEENKRQTRRKIQRIEAAVSLTGKIEDLDKMLEEI